MLKSAAKTVALNNGADTLLVSSSETRVSITFSPFLNTTFVGGNILLRAGSPVTSTTDDQAVLSVVAGGFTPLTLHRDVHGDIVQREWHAWAAAANQRMGILEAIEE